MITILVLMFFTCHLRANTPDGEALEQKKTFQSEIMIIKSEVKAIEMLKVIIKKKKNTYEEADLLFRLAELYMRRSKSGRFFDLNQDAEIKLKNLGLASESSHKQLTEAIAIYHQLINNFKKFSERDAVYFNLAMAYAKQSKLNEARQLYGELILQFPNSTLIPDALLEAGEIDYQKQRFSAALEQFKAIEKFKNSRAYPYGLYKSAWCHYNLKQTELGISQMKEVLRINPANQIEINKFNLRQEGLRDLALFASETIPAKQIVSFFSEITTPEELGVIVIALINLYESHSRFSEIIIFSEEFVSSKTQNLKTPEVITRLIQTHETLKNRDAVIAQLNSMSLHCKKIQENEACTTLFKKISLEITKKWWDIWLKNKLHSQFSDLTRQAFEILLNNDSISNPDANSRFAYAELLFQTQKYQDSEKQYEIVSNYTKIEAILKHDALYGALFSLEKLAEQNKIKETSELQIKLLLRYKNEFPKGEQIIPVIYKIALNYYQQNDYPTALNYLALLGEKNLSEETRVKTEDMILDIYNIKKDYVTLLAQLKMFISKSTLNSERKKGLELTEQQTQYSVIQSIDIQKNSTALISKLIEFAEQYKMTTLGQKAHWQAISLAYSTNEDFRAAKLSELYLKNYPSDEKNYESMQDSLKIYIDSAHLADANRVIRILMNYKKSDSASLKSIECQLLSLQGGNSEDLINCYTQLYLNSTLTEKINLLPNYLNILKNSDKKSEYKKLQFTIVNQQIEPFATQILTEEANSLFTQGYLKEAFQMSLKINARHSDENSRAGARLIQAQILQKEFEQQSLKTNSERLSLVLSMKAEKLDKSFTAFSSALKMTDTLDTQIKCLTGIGLLYEHFINALENIQLSDNTSTNEQQAVKSELKKISSAFIDKKIENKNKISELLNKNIRLGLNATNNSSLPQPIFTQFNDYFTFSDTTSWSQIKKNKSTSCQENTATENLIYNCINENKLEIATRLSLKLAESKAQRGLALNYLGLIAILENQTSRSVWLLEKSILLNPTLKNTYYQLARIEYLAQGPQAYLKYYDKIFDTSNNIKELQVLKAFQSFSLRDYSTANLDFSRLSTEENYTYGMEHLYLESLLQSKDLTKLNVLAEKILKFYQDQLDKNLSKEQTLAIQQKINYLQVTYKNKLTSYVGGQ